VGCGHVTISGQYALCVLRGPESALPTCRRAIRHPDIRVKHCAYGHSVATLLNPRGVTTVSHKYSLTAARHATVVVAVPSIVHYPPNFKIKIYYLRCNLKV
jgi:hypothetical protein